MNDVELTDLHWDGLFLTWSNKRYTDYLAKKLDKFLDNGLWLDTFHAYRSSFLPPDFLDHCAGILSFYKLVHMLGNFKFFNYLVKHKDFLPTVASLWCSDTVYKTEMFKLCKKL